MTLTLIYCIQTNSISQNKIETEYQISVKAMDFIKVKNVDGLKELIYKGAFKNTSDEQFKEVVNELYDIINSEENPTMDRVLLMTSVSQFNGQNTNIYSLGFPFPSKLNREDERGFQVVFMFSKEIKKNKIIGWKIRDFGAPLLRQEEEDKKNIPTLNKFDFKTKNIIEFRVVYKEQYSIENHFEISGDSAELKKINIKTKIDEIFLIINDSKIEKTEYKFVQSLRNHPSLELDALQFVFSNYDLKLYPKFEIVYIVSEDPEISKDYNGYLVVHHGPFRYFISTKDNVAIVDKIIALRKMILK